MTARPLCFCALSLFLSAFLLVFRGRVGGGPPARLNMGGVIPRSAQSADAVFLQKTKIPQDNPQLSQICSSEVKPQKELKIWWILLSWLQTRKQQILTITTQESEILSVDEDASFSPMWSYRLKSMEELMFWHKGRFHGSVGRDFWLDNYIMCTDISSSEKEPEEESCMEILGVWVSFKRFNLF